MISCLKELHREYFSTGEKDYLINHSTANNILARELGPKQFIAQSAENIFRFIRVEILRRPQPQDLYPFQNK